MRGQPANKVSATIAAWLVTCSQLSKSQHERLVPEVCEQCLEQRAIGNFLYADRRGYRSNHQGRITDGSESDEANDLVSGVTQSGPDLQDRLSFADAAGTGEGDEPMIAHKCCDLVELGLSPDEAG